MSPAIAVTGAGGYIGGRLVRHLEESGATVLAVVGRRRPWLSVEQVEVDLASGDRRLDDALRGVDAVVHLAGSNEVDVAADPAAAIDRTVRASTNVASTVGRSGVRRLVLLSTVHVYGTNLRPGALVSEDVEPAPTHPYALARLRSEQETTSELAGAAELVVLRLTNAVGAPADARVDRWSLVANDLSRQAVTTGRLELRTSGAQWRDFVDLGDACAAIRAGCAQLPPGTYNVGSGRPTTVRALAEVVADCAEVALGSRPELVAPDPEVDAAGPYRIAVDRLAGHGVTATTSLPASVLETVRFCMDAAGRLP